jgi:hypothetical protein
MIYVQTVIPLRSARWFSSPSQQSFDVCESRATHVNGVLNIDVLLQHDRRIPRLCEELNNISLGHSSEVNIFGTGAFFDLFCVLSSSHAKHIVFTELCRLVVSVFPVLH